ncbi:glycosyltransferase family 2 protein [Lutibacter flavus]|uniref:Glycosyltransferase involved in cell wall bisynthesis n=1 Tax=Lutibacter flavus TaxID=691689 RepID=A0A238YZ91_9FLAO|nr:glycosyltransferase [Lutibacter flavus]SNR75994.1 Glycosyltransferase involved in cell wall bisynthesis [Lutibacter flavus]
MNLEDFKLKYQKQPVIEYSNSVKESPLVSVCVVTYQHASYIKDCLEGILMQKTTFSFEILLGEDASTDGTREICIEYAKKYSDKIKLFLHHRENNIKINGSFSGRFNFIYNLYNAKGKYIALCDGDDYWTDPLKLQKQFEFLEANTDYSLCFTSRKIFKEVSKEDSFEILKNQTFSSENILKGMIPFTQTIVYRNSANYLLKFEKYIKQDAGDRILSYILSLEGKIKGLQDITSVYRFTGQGVWSSKHQGTILFANLDSLQKFYKDIGLTEQNKYFYEFLYPIHLKILFDMRISFLNKMKEFSKIKKRYSFKNKYYFKYLLKYILELFSVLKQRNNK